MIKIQFLTTDSTRPLIDWATAVSLLDIQKKAPGRTVVHSFRGIGGCDEDLHEIEADATKYGISMASSKMLLLFTRAMASCASMPGLPWTM